MASRELYSSIAKPKKKITFGQQLGDAGKLLADTALSGIGASDIIKDDMYNTDWAQGASNVLSPLASVAGGIGLSALTAGLVGPKKFNKGGLRTFEGNTHEEGGIPLGNDEVEGSETMMPMDNQSDFIFSDRLYPIKSISSKGKITYGKKSFAQLSKQINKPLEIRPNDAYSKRTIDRKLGKLAQEQEALKQANVPQEFAMGGMRYDDGGWKTRRDANRSYREWSKNVFAPSLLQPQDYSNMGPENYMYSENTPQTISGKSPIQQVTIPINRQFPTFSGELSEEAYIDDIPFDTSRGNTLTSMPTLTARGVPPSGKKDYVSNIGMTPKGFTPETASTVGLQSKWNKSAAAVAATDNIDSNTNYKSNFLPTAIGYGVQALTNLPALLAKPETKNFSRVKFDDISLAEQRNEARRSRNLGLATARGIGAQSGDIGQTMNYLSGTNAAMNSQYGNLFNQSLMQEKQYNSELGMKEQLANSEIERYEEGINTQEADSIRNLKMQALSNLGGAAAMTGRDYMGMNNSDNMLNVLMGSNPDYTYEVLAKKGLLGQPGLKPVRRKVALGGKRGRTV